MELKTKICTKCKKQKLLSEFYKDKRAIDGLHSECKDCTNDYARKRYLTHKPEAAKRLKCYRKTLIGCLRHRFQAMKQRCNNPKNVMYKYYGKRGIKVKFKNADEFVGYVIDKLKVDPRNLDIDRINNDGNYEPGNIRLVTHIENMNNRRNYDIN